MKRSLDTLQAYQLELAWCSTGSTVSICKGSSIELDPDPPPEPPPDMRHRFNFCNVLFASPIFRDYCRAISPKP